MKNTIIIATILSLMLALTACGDMPNYGSLVEPSFSITTDSISMHVGETYPLKISVSISNVLWESSADTVATVDYRGNVQALSVGKTTITASRPNSYITSHCIVLVTEAIDTQEE